MSLTYPLDILNGSPFWSTEFELLWRQEQSRQANGRTIVKDFGTPLWRATYVSKTQRPNALDQWRARLTGLENGLQTFKGYSLSRCYPILYPNGSWPTGLSFDGVSATLNTIDANRKAVRVDDLPIGFTLSVGDYISLRDAGSPPVDLIALHQVMEAATADGSGLTPQFEIRPHLAPEVDTSFAVSVLRPHCIMSIVPGTIASAADPSTGQGTISFQAIEAR